LVVVPISASDASGRPVRDLTLGDFQVEEEGKAQQIVSLGEPGKTPVEIALLFDISGSTNAQFSFEQRAAAEFVKDVLKPNDTLTVFSIGCVPKLVQARTTNPQDGINGINSLSPSKDPTAFFDAVVDGATYLGKHAEVGGRRVVLVISDGEENFSERSTLKDALEYLLKNDCLFYAINPTGAAITLNRVSLKGQSFMDAMSAQTGGKAFLPERIEDLSGVFKQVAEELQAQYLFGYYSTDVTPDGGFRRITVKTPKRPELRLRARQGYYAPKS